MAWSKEDSDILAIAAGDNAAFCRIYEKYKNEMYRYALSILKNSQAAEDILHDSFVAIKQNANTYTVGNEKAWIMRIVHNLSVNYIRENSKEYPTDSFPQLSTEIKDSFDELLELIPSITDRQIVSLKIDSGFKTKEIADILDLTPNAVSKRYRRTLKMLKKIL